MNELNISDKLQPKNFNSIKMKTFTLFAVVNLIYFTTAFGKPRVDAGTSRCANVWDEGCINGQLPGSGRDDDYINGVFNPGKRCINVWDEGCTNGQLPGSGRDDDYINGVFNPGKRCLDTLGGGCNNGWLESSGGSLGHRNQLGNQRVTSELLARLYKNKQH